MASFAWKLSRVLIHSYKFHASLWWTAWKISFILADFHRLWLHKFEVSVCILYFVTRLAKSVSWTKSCSFRKEKEELKGFISTTGADKPLHFHEPKCLKSVAGTIQISICSALKKKPTWVTQGLIDDFSLTNTNLHWEIILKIQSCCWESAKKWLPFQL